MGYERKSRKIYFLHFNSCPHRAGSRDEMRWSPYIEDLWTARMPKDHAWFSMKGADEMKGRTTWVWRNSGMKFVEGRNVWYPENNLRKHHIYHQSVLPKNRSFSGNAGNKAAVLSKGRSSNANSGTKVAVLLGINRCGSFPLISTPHSLFII